MSKIDQGHDKRYALNSSKINKNLSGNLNNNFERIRKNFLWYLKIKSYFKSLKKDHIIKRLGKI